MAFLDVLLDGGVLGLCVVDERVSAQARHL
jgi:hypothetical protein